MLPEHRDLKQRAHCRSRPGDWHITMSIFKISIEEKKAHGYLQVRCGMECANASAGTLRVRSVVDRTLPTVVRKIKKVLNTDCT